MRAVSLVTCKGLQLCCPGCSLSPGPSGFSTTGNLAQLLHKIVAFKQQLSASFVWLIACKGDSVLALARSCAEGLCQWSLLCSPSESWSPTACLQETRCFDALAELYSALSEEDVLFGLWKRRCGNEETRSALSMMQHGNLEQGQEMFETCIQKAAQGQGEPVTHCLLNNVLRCSKSSKTLLPRCSWPQHCPQSAVPVIPTWADALLLQVYDHAVLVLPA